MYQLLQYSSTNYKDMSYNSNSVFLTQCLRCKSTRTSTPLSPARNKTLISSRYGGIDTLSFSLLHHYFLHPTEIQTTTTELRVISTHKIVFMCEKRSGWILKKDKIYKITLHHLISTETWKELLSQKVQCESKRNDKECRDIILYL